MTLFRAKDLLSDVPAAGVEEALDFDIELLIIEEMSEWRVN